MAQNETQAPIPEALFLRSPPDPIIHVPSEALIVDGMHVMSQTAQLMDESCR